MILFFKDWQEQGALPDWTTPNKSFLEYVSLLKKMGIKNHAFCLALHDQDLKGIDPHSTELTEMQILKITAECKRNPWYFFREVARRPAQSGDSATFVEANRGNISLWWCFMLHITYILIQPRQTGKSFSVDQMNTYFMNIRCTGTNIDLLTKDDTLRTKNLIRIKEIEGALPSYLALRNKNDTSNTERFTINALRNAYTAHVPQKSPKDAEKVGRGLTSAIFQIDEPPFQSNIKIIMEAALPAGNAARDIARKNNEPYGTILTTTAGDIDDRDGGHIYTLLQEAMEWSERLFDAVDQEDLEAQIRKNSRKGVLRINGTFSHLQLGKDDAWLKRTIEENMLGPAAVNRELMNQWQSGSAMSPIPAAQLLRIKASAKDEVFVDISKVGNYITKWYIPEQEVLTRLEYKTCVFAMDTSEGGGNDDISFYLIDIETLETMAVGVYNETNLLTMAEWVFSWFVKYPKFTAIIERRSTGQFLIDVLCKYMIAHGMNPFKRLFNLAVHNKDENPDRFDEVMRNGLNENVVSRYKTLFGYATSGSGMMSRNELYGTTLQLAAKQAADVVYDRALIGQIATLIVKNGRIDHQDGQHDDLVIGWLLAIWFLSKGKNMQCYGIDPKDIMSAVNLSKAIPEEELIEMQEQRHYRMQMKDIVTQMQNETDEYVIANLERMLRHLNTKLILSDGEHFSIDALLDSLKDNRRTILSSMPRDNHGWSSTRMGNIYEAMQGNRDGTIQLSY